MVIIDNRFRKYVYGELMKRLLFVVTFLMLIGLLSSAPIKGLLNSGKASNSGSYFDQSKLKQISNTTEVGKVPNSSPLKQAKNWILIKEESFEGVWPNQWNCYSKTDVDAYWSDNNDMAYEGNWSGHCCDGGEDSIENGYQNNMETWMVYGPFSLADCADAELNYNVWYHTESDYDYFKVYASINGSSYWGYRYDGQSNGWESKSFDLTDVYEIGNVTGKNNVWIAFVFTSDLSNTYEGAYIDNINLTRNYVAPDAYVSPVMFNSYIADEIDSNQDGYYESLNLLVDVDAQSPSLKDVIRAQDCTINVYNHATDEMICSGGPFHFTGSSTEDNAIVGPITMQEWDDNDEFVLRVEVSNEFGSDTKTQVVSLQGLYTPNADNVNQVIKTDLNNYPNPFNPETTISFTLKKRERATLEIFNMRGQSINRLISEELSVGSHHVVWDGNDSNGKSVATGVYFYRLITPTMSQAKRMLLMK